MGSIVCVTSASLVNDIVQWITVPYLLCMPFPFLRGNISAENGTAPFGMFDANKKNRLACVLEHAISFHMVESEKTI